MAGNKRYTVMSNKRDPIIDPDQAMIYQIKIQNTRSGCLPQNAVKPDRILINDLLCQ
jgi:hypothetical protein